MEWGFFPYFPPLKPKGFLWSGASYSQKNTKLSESQQDFLSYGQCYSKVIQKDERTRIENISEKE